MPIRRSSCRCPIEMSEKGLFILLEMSFTHLSRSPSRDRMNLRSVTKGQIRLDQISKLELSTKLLWNYEFRFGKHIFQKFTSWIISMFGICNSPIAQFEKEQLFVITKFPINNEWTVVKKLCLFNQIITTLVRNTLDSKLVLDNA